MFLPEQAAPVLRTDASGIVESGIGVEPAAPRSVCEGGFVVVYKKKARGKFKHRVETKLPCTGTEDKLCKKLPKVRDVDIS